MTFIGLVLVLLGLVGWSVEEESGSAATPSPAESEPAPPGPEGGKAKPPPIVLRSAAGTQVAVAESSCVTAPSTAVCIDTNDQQPEDLSVVRPGEKVVLSLRGASVTGGSVLAGPLPSCENATVSELELEPGAETRWRVDLPPGQYELEVFARFEAAGGRSGDVSGSLGLLVDATQAQEILPVPATFVGC
ncbi:MAG TPA: hypothetical protein VE644_01330 [Gaiellaceae bacterium]|nr:hypothetical protein [Gaiellaceae bacterium]